jgi:MoaA/NifB/PqqE/SkfB family radical SAM enzyme
MIEAPIQSEVLQYRALRPAFDLPPQVCFRVTRFCNARCGFCLAPPDGGIHPAAATLKGRIDWLLAHGVRTIHFCGGEPTIHRDLSGLIGHVREEGGKSKLTTNGIALPDVLIPTLRASRTQVKVSLHGDQPHHDEIVGREAFRYTTATIQRLLAAGIETSVQTTVVTRHLDVVLWVIRYCLDNKVRRVSFLPFIPRGSGLARQIEYGLTRAERIELRDLIKEKRRAHNRQLDIRLLDFNTHSVPVVEPDGRIILEGATETMDQLLGQIPGQS